MMVLLAVTRRGDVAACGSSAAVPTMGFVSCNNTAVCSTKQPGTYLSRHPSARNVGSSASRPQRLSHPTNVSPTKRAQVALPHAVVQEISNTSEQDSASLDSAFVNPSRPVRVLIAGGGIAGLVLAVALLKKGVDVRVYEQDMTAIRGEGKYRGPIQVQSNALAALEAIDPNMAAEVMQAGCITGDRINGLCDGVSGEWYCKFDTYHPAVDNGLPVTRVISRVTLQQILAKYAVQIGGEDVIQAESKVVSFREDKVDGHDRVWAELADGRHEWGDILIGADGIWSKVRTQLIGHRDASYSGYTCYTGISDFVCPDIDTVAYRVFLGNGQYFVSSDVGGGKMQWYAFHEEPTGGFDPEGQQKQRLMGIFGHCGRETSEHLVIVPGECAVDVGPRFQARVECRDDMVTDLIAATPEEDVIRRDIYDRAPIFKWTKGRVALLGDSAHAMQPNLGQGGCMAIEDAYELGKLFDETLYADNSGSMSALDMPVEKILRRYQNERMMRASAIHGMARMAAIAASTYKAYLGEQFHLEDKIKIPHPGRVAGRFVLGATMPAVLGWVLGGNTRKLKTSDRAQYCNIDDQPHGFAESEWGTLLNDDEALLRAAQADWVLAPLSSQNNEAQAMLLEEGVTIGSANSNDVVLQNEHVEGNHAVVHYEKEMYYLEDCGTSDGTFLNGRKLAARQSVQLHPGDYVTFGSPVREKNITFKVKLMHKSQRDIGLLQHDDEGSTHRMPVCTKRSEVESVVV